MDPNTTWRVLVDGSASDWERRQAAEDLMHWVVLGGFLPTGVGWTELEDAIDAIERTSSAGG